MNAKVIKIGIGMCACLALGTSVVLAKDNPFGTYTAGSVHTASSSASLKPPFLTTDNLKEFTQQQLQEIENFKKQKLDELKAKTAQLKGQRKQCESSIKTLMDQRKAARLELIKSCKPTFTTGEPTSADEAKQRALDMKAAYLACRQEIENFKKQKLDELKAKTAQLKGQRKQCESSIKTLMDQRKAARLELIKSCKPTFTTGEPTSADEAKQRALDMKAAYLACRQKL